MSRSEAVFELYDTGAQSPIYALPFWSTFSAAHRKRNATGYAPKDAQHPLITTKTHSARVKMIDLIRSWFNVSEKPVSNICASNLRSFICANNTAYNCPLYIPQDDKSNRKK